MAPPKRPVTESEEEDLHSPPKRMKKTKNRANNDDDASDAGPATQIPAISFIDFIHDMKEYGNDKLKPKGKPDISKIADGVPMLQKYHDFYSQPSFVSEFNALYKTASRRKNIPMELVVDVIDRYLSDGQTVEQFHGFPRAPLLPIDAYVSENRDVEHGKPGDMVKLRKEFASGSIDTKPYFDEYADECKMHALNLKKYLEKNSSKLRESHKTYIRTLITKFSKKKVAKEKKIAFEWFKDANPELYADKDEETRDRKLQRKFNKLEEAEKRIYENIAAANP